MVITVESDGRSGPVEEGWRGWLSGIDLSVFQLALAPGVIGRGAAKDHEAVVDDREVVVLLLAIALVLFGPLAGVALPLGTPGEVVFHHVTLLEGVFDRASVVRAQFLEHLIKNSQATLRRGSGVLALSGSHKGSLHDCLAFFFFLELRLEPPSSAFSCRFSFPLVSWKIAPTASSPEAKLVAMSRSSLVVHGPLCPNSWMSSLQVVPARNAPMTSASVTLGNSVHCREKC
jgi:hypothetical protein